jgi:membrane fusion protein, multidrug efflux system
VQSCSRGSGADKPAGGGRGAEATIKVFATTVQAASWRGEVRSIGTAAANESITLTAKVAETVKRINFQDGQLVAQGAVLVELSGNQEIASLKEAQAQYEDAQKQYQRISELIAQGTVTKAALDSQIAARDGAAARREVIRARLQDRVITAPFAGVVGLRRVSPGALLSVGTIITTLDDISTIKVDFSVPESQLARIAAGDTVRAVSEALGGREFTGQIDAVDSRVDPLSRAARVRAKFANDDSALKPGMLLEVHSESAPRDLLVVPEIAVIQRGENAFLFRIKADQTVEEVKVVLGDRDNGMVEIKSGLTLGDKIVRDGIVKLKTGSKIAELASPTA